MENNQIPHQMVQNLENLQFFSNFDSGNLHRAVKVANNQVRVK
jgi:hypothetical protein